jgi:signal transduction histidine kinase
VSVEAFQTRARTIDHLGRGQIADCPTAVSELWKNAYDAYARNVALHIFEGTPAVAAITDDGHGMDQEEFLNRWLVVGTETKVSAGPTPEKDRNGLPLRESQGEKGIGRLSVAFLGPVVFVISKRRGKPFVAALVDWRIFENPYLLLADIRLPVEEFEQKEELKDLLPKMFASLGENVRGPKDDQVRKKRLVSAWARYSAVQDEREGADTASAILATAVNGTEFSKVLLERCLIEWKVWGGSAKHGTALFVIEVNHELAVWVDPDVSDDDPEANAIKKSLQETLTGFVDPYLPSSMDFAYSVKVHKGDKPRSIVSSDRLFSWGELLALEHVVHGRVDEAGVFRGRVKAFGRDLGEVTINAAQRPVPVQARFVVGPFDICIATFELERLRTSLSPEQHRHAAEMAERHAGLAIYRDQLRVMPYGRAQADFFGIEERRSFHAGREFWSFRRTFGRVAITRAENPNLKDKAGREGLIDNRAKREFRLLVVELLKATARRFFNKQSKPYREYLPDIIAENTAAQEAEEKAQDRRSTQFRKAIRERAAPLAEAVESAATAMKELSRVIADSDLGSLVALEKKIIRLEVDRTNLRLPPKPAKLGRMEEDYREYRDRYSNLCSLSEELRQGWAEAVERVKKKPAVDEGRATATAHSEQLTDMLKEWQVKIVGMLKSEEKRLRGDVARDTDRYSAQAAPLIGDLAASRTKLPDFVRQLEAIREALHLEFAQRYGGYARVLENLAAGIDVDALTAWSAEQRQELQGKVDQLHALAQLGVTVEMVGHELETHDEEIRRHLNSMSDEAREEPAWQDLRASIQALFDRLRFVTPLQLSGKRFLKEISGAEIADYVAEFFGSRFKKTRVEFTATPKFRGIKIREYAARIYPVFINLVNNSLYWVTFGQKRMIRFDVVGDDVVVSDTGRGIDPDDIGSLFQLFFTRRTGGRGVGLYLCRANLAAGGHTIAYANETKYRLLPGANFVIRFRDMTHA